jgi:hypothetical protein
MNKGLQEKKTTAQIWPGLGRSSACRPNSERGQRLGAPTGGVRRSAAGRAKPVSGGVGHPIKRISTAEGRLLPLDATGTRRNRSRVQAGVAALLGAASDQAEATRGRGALGRARRWAGRPDSASRKLTS